MAAGLDLDGMAMMMPLFEQAVRLEAGRQVVDDEIDAVFAQCVEPAAAAAGR